MTKITLMITTLACVFFLGCQNSANEEDKSEDKATQLNPLDLPLNTMKYKFGGTQITLSNATYSVVAGSTHLGAPGPGQFIIIDTAAPLTPGAYNKASNPAYWLVHDDTNFQAHSSSAGNANIIFDITVTPTEIMGTFSGTTESTPNGGITTQITNGVFRITK